MRLFKKSKHDNRDMEETLEDEYLIYLKHANNGDGLDVTNNLKPLKTYNEWKE